MPEAVRALPGGQRELILARRAAELPPGVAWVALGAEADLAREPPGPRLSLDGVLRPQRERLRKAFVEWLGRINVANAGIAWWAYTTSAKNLLASRFGDEVFELLGLRLLLETTEHSRIGVLGASAAQGEVLAALARRERWRLRVSGVGHRTAGAGYGAARVLFDALQVFGTWLRWFRRERRPATDAGQIHILTYADRAFRAENDAFFGPLARLLGERHPPLRCRVHAYVHGRAREVVPLLRAAKVSGYAPLFAELSALDIARTAADTWRALLRAARWPRPEPLDGLDLGPVLRAALRRDVACGAYFRNLLVYRAMRRLGARLRPEVFLYPYENKSLEKLALVGLRESHPGCRTIGYQHTSVTPRHTTLLFAPGEAARTPLPDRIVTAGAVTRRYLEAHGNYPPGLLVEGCALRQRQRAPLARRPRGHDRGSRVLLALSSSVAELRAACRLLAAAARRATHWELGIRPHPEFPLSLLTADLRAMLAGQGRDLSGTPLDENLAWADVVLYASSTVAIEALMAGRPVVYLDLGEPLEVDPILEPVPLRWHARSAEELVAAVEAIGALDEAEFADRAAAARRFAQEYFRPCTERPLDLLVRIEPA